MSENNKKEKLKEAMKRFDNSTKGTKEERAKEAIEINNELSNMGKNTFNNISTNIFKNANGTDYVILKQKDDIALLVAVGISQFVVCYGLDYNSNCWGGGSYFSNLDNALECFEKAK